MMNMKKDTLTDRGSTWFLRGAILAIGLAVLALCSFALVPTLVTSHTPAEYRFLLLGMLLAAIPFYIGLYQGLKLLGYIDKNAAFSNASVQALKVVTYCALTISVVYLPCLPLFYRLTQQTDAPGLMVIGLGLAGAPAVVAVFAAVLQKLLRNAIDMKSENDLMV